MHIKWQLKSKFPRYLTTLNIKITRNLLTWVVGDRRRAHRRPSDAEAGAQVHGQVVQHHLHVRDGDEVGSLRLQEVLHGRLVLAGLHHRRRQYNLMTTTRHDTIRSAVLRALKN